MRGVIARRLPAGARPRAAAPVRTARRRPRLAAACPRAPPAPSHRDRLGPAPPPPRVPPALHRAGGLVRGLDAHRTSRSRSRSTSSPARRCWSACSAWRRSSRCCSPPCSAARSRTRTTAAGSCWSPTRRCSCFALVLLANALLADPHVWVLFVVAAGMAARGRAAAPAAGRDAAAARAARRAAGRLGARRLPRQRGADRRAGARGRADRDAGLGATYAIDAATFLVSLVALARMRAVPPPPEAAPPSLARIREGWRYARSRQELSGRYAVDINAMLFGIPVALFPAVAEPLRRPGGARPALRRRPGRGRAADARRAGGSAACARHGTRDRAQRRRVRRRDRRLRLRRLARRSRSSPSPRPARPTCRRGSSGRCCGTRRSRTTCAAGSRGSSSSPTRSGRRSARPARARVAARHERAFSIVVGRRRAASPAPSCCARCCRASGATSAEADTVSA